MRGRNHSGRGASSAGYPVAVPPSPTLSAALGAAHAVATLRLTREDLLPRPSETFLYEPTRAGSRPPVCDVYLPRVQEPLGFTLLLHGGGFTTGNRSMRPTRRLAGALLARGEIVFAVDYPLARRGTTVFDQVASVERGLAAAASRAARAGARHARGVVLGTSAGATLAMLAAPRAQEHVARVVACFGLYDFLDLPLPERAARALRRLVLGDPSPSSARLASPLHASHPSDVVLLHGDADRLVPVRQHLRMEAALRAAGGRVAAHVFPGAPHAFFNDGATPPCAEALAVVVAAVAEVHPREGRPGPL
jgi:acetyl esterase/lipase